MRKFAFALFASFLLASLHGQEINFSLPAIGRCTAKELRIRAFPSLKEDSSSVIGSLASGDELIVLGRLGDTVTIDGLRSSWYAVIGMDGVQGWSFGGYVDIGSAKINVFEYADDISGLAREEFETLAVDGGVCRRFRFSGPIPEAEAVFAKTAAGSPQVIYLNYTDYIGYASVAGMKAVDYFGDASKELCIEMNGGGGDEGGTAIYLFGRSARDTRYTAYGDISLSEFSGGGGWNLGSGGSVVEGPSPVISGKNRCIRLVKRFVAISPVDDKGDGYAYRRIDESKVEELYGLSGSKVVLMKRTTLAEESVEERMEKETTSGN